MHWSPASRPSDRSVQAGEVADAQAIAQAAQRYQDLQEELAEAEQFNDLAATERLQTEMDQIVQYLTQAKGFAGRRRQAGDDADRLRRAVKQAIDRVIDRLRDTLPAAARHFDDAIHTGLFLSYEPQQQLPWAL